MGSGSDSTSSSGDDSTPPSKDDVPPKNLKDESAKVDSKTDSTGAEIPESLSAEEGGSMDSTYLDPHATADTGKSDEESESSDDSKSMSQEGTNDQVHEEPDPEHLRPRTAKDIEEEKEA